MPLYNLKVINVGTAFYKQWCYYLTTTTATISLYCSDTISFKPKLGTYVKFELPFWREEYINMFNYGSKAKIHFGTTSSLFTLRQVTGLVFRWLRVFNLSRNGDIEDEIHFLCPEYESYRIALYRSAQNRFI